MLKKAVRFICVCSLIMSSMLELYAQNDSINQLKYGWMRFRLRNYFQHMGTDEGESLPAGLIREYKVCKELGRPSRIIDWGDGTIFHGWYLGVLGTEYKLLRQQNQATDSTLKELYLAFEAFDRLDYNAEVVWSNFNGETRKGKINEVKWDSVNRRWIGSVEGQINGFFLRNDAPPDFVKHFPFAVGIGSALSGVYDENDTVWYGEWKVCPPFIYKANTYYPMNEPSHDQIFPLLMGLMLVYECADDAMVYNGQNLGERARLTALRMIDHYDQDWKYRNPVRTEYGFGCNDEGCLPYNGGGHSFAYSYPLAIMGNYFKNGVKLNKRGIGQVFKDLNNPYLTGVSFASSALWRNLTPLFFNHHVNHHMEVVIGSISNSYAGKNSTRSARYLWERVHDNKVGWEFYYLLNKYLYPNKTNYWPEDQIQYELNICPVNGPHWLFDDKKNAEYTVPWHISNRYVFGFKNGYQWSVSDSLNPWFKGYFSGTDYMLLYNIYRLVYPESYKSIYSLNEWMGSEIEHIKTRFIATKRVFARQIEIENLSTSPIHIKLYNSENKEYYSGRIIENIVFDTSKFPPGLYTLIVFNPENLKEEWERVALIRGDDLYKDSEAAKLTR